MSNGRVCCLLGVCCRRAKQVAAWKTVFVEAGVPPAQAEKAANAAASEIEAMGDLEAAVKNMKAAHPGPPED